MNNILNLELLQAQGARFIRIPKGLKSPKTNDWHKFPLTVSEIDINDNIGILLNEHSNGIVAIDFDGVSSIDYFYKLFPNTQIPDTVSFTSTRHGRHQKLFKIPNEYYEFLSLKQLKTGFIDVDGKNEQLELRFQYKKAAQSVLPLSVVSDELGTRTYQYLVGLSPQDVEICQLPEEVLVYWLTICNDLTESKEIVELPHTEDMIVHLCETLKKHYNTLNYEEWIRVAWALKNSLGESIALDLMKYYYPEKKSGEYRKLMRNNHNGKRCTLGTIRYMIKQRGGYCANNDEEINLCRLLNSKNV